MSLCLNVVLVQYSHFDLLSVVARVGTGASAD